MEVKIGLARCLYAGKALGFFGQVEQRCGAEYAALLFKGAGPAGMFGYKPGRLGACAIAWALGGEETLTPALGGDREAVFYQQGKSVVPQHGLAGDEGGFTARVPGCFVGVF